mmetsp:Transcript_115890/g.338914  ORF Transcript_115890/g.338914 Transcript_115890/m.338914 type:complete len:267 (+) Transcript_115890:810-1610(+)
MARMATCLTWQSRWCICEDTAATAFSSPNSEILTSSSRATSRTWSSASAKHLAMAAIARSSLWSAMSAMARTAVSRMCQSSCSSRGSMAERTLEQPSSASCASASTAAPLTRPSVSSRRPAAVATAVSSPLSATAPITLNAAQRMVRSAWFSWAKALARAALSPLGEARARSAELQRERERLEAALLAQRGAEEAPEEEEPQPTRRVGEAPAGQKETCAADVAEERAAELAVQRLALHRAYLLRLDAESRELQQRCAQAEAQLGVA